MWRSQWERDHSPDVKQKLITYNAEDCQAAERVACAIDAICRADRGQRADVVNVDALKKGIPSVSEPLNFISQNSARSMKHPTGIISGTKSMCDQTSN